MSANKKQKQKQTTTTGSGSSSSEHTTVTSSENVNLEVKGEKVTEQVPLSVAEQITKAIEQLIEQHPECHQVYSHKKHSLSLLKQTADGLLDTYFYGATKRLDPAVGLTIAFVAAASSTTATNAANTSGSSSLSSIGERVVHRITLPAATHTAFKFEEAVPSTIPGQPPSTKSMIGIHMKSEFQALLQAAEVSPFGHQKETVIDTKVRKAKHIPAERIVEISGFRVEEIVDELKINLFPQEPNMIAKLLKLNIYQEGDFFKPHRDTPLSPDSLGSLVVALPVAHRGGELWIQHRDEEQTFRFAYAIAPNEKQRCSTALEALEKGIYDVSSGSSAGDPAKETQRKQLDDMKLKCGLAGAKISYAAFYGDCIHEIKPVTGGMRLTLSYQLLRRGDSTAPSNATSSVVATDNIEIPSVIEKTLPPHEARNILNYYSNVTGTVLKRWCSYAGVPVSGSKSVLIDRLMESKNVKFVKTNSGSVEPRFIDSDTESEPIPLNKESAAARANLFRLALLQSLVNGDLDDCSVGFPCYHLYEGEEDLPNLKGFRGKKLTAKDLKRLRGADALMMLVAANAGFDVSLIRLVNIDDGGEGVTAITKILPSKKTAVKLMTRKEWIDESFKANAISLEEFPMEEDQYYDLESITWIKDYEDTSSVPRQKLLETYISTTGYFGNESGHGTVYAQCALVIDFPDSSCQTKIEIAEALLRQPIVPEMIESVPGGKRMQ